MTSSDHLASTPVDFLAALDSLVGLQKCIARMQAIEAALYAACGDYADATSPANSAAADLERDITFRSTAMELGAALRVSDRTVSGRIDEARHLRERFPLVLGALTRGEITQSHARVITQAGGQIGTPEARDEYQRRILPIAESETPARTRSIARVIASRIEPDVAAKHQEAAACTRTVHVVDLDDGLAALTAILPAVLAHGIHDRLTQAARLVATGERRAAKIARTADGASSSRSDEECSTDMSRSDDATFGTDAADSHPVPARAEARDQIGPADHRLRRIDEIRADLLCDLLLTACPSETQIPVLGRDGIDLGAIRGHVQVVVTADALFGADDALPILTGSGPIPIDQARLLAGQEPAWDRLTIDPAQRTLLSVERYRPTPAQRRYLASLDEHCRQPGCRRVAMRCDVDHAFDAALGGATNVDNLSPLCKPHHTVKHADGWTLDRLPDGRMSWTSKHGRVYPDIPRPTVAFMITGPLPDEAPAPF